MGIFSKAELDYIKNPKKYELYNVDYAYVLRHRIIKKVEEFQQIYRIIKVNPFLMKSLGRDLNPRPSAYKALALTRLSYRGYRLPRLVHSTAILA